MKSVAVAAVAAVLFPAGAAYADDGAREGGPAPLIGDVTVFNDEIVEPVSLPVSTCGGVLSLLSRAPSDCHGASRVSDDDA
ncbi:hypothetical protein ETD86_53270 [Nonomuraea turkmeniaca]|uniref:Chaplin n=1 Tax=Nonomuraea turkmeniaca TaxID=103838 RepID=A0A5S4EV31_9ACTN|nr:hypothetical protein [Nonomuraea turkmeniaca]TMR05381.1 hypothetical protein ETD86_53270 [Nonomuraea turkmeniaca]